MPREEREEAGEVICRHLDRPFATERPGVNQLGRKQLRRNSGRGGRGLALSRRLCVPMQSRCVMRMFKSTLLGGRPLLTRRSEGLLICGHQRSEGWITSRISSHKTDLKVWQSDAFLKQTHPLDSMKNGCSFHRPYARFASPALGRPQSRGCLRFLQDCLLEIGSQLP